MQRVQRRCSLTVDPRGLVIAVQDYSHTIAAGSRGRVEFRLFSTYPVTLVQVKFGVQVVGEMNGNDLRDVLAIGFSVPRRGTYNLTVSATDNLGRTVVTTTQRRVTVE